MNITFLSLKDVTAKYANEIHAAVARVIDSGWYLQGAENARFEEDYARYIGTRHCVGCVHLHHRGPVEETGLRPEKHPAIEQTDSTEYHLRDEI